MNCNTAFDRALRRIRRQTDAPLPHFTREDAPEHGLALSDSKSGNSQPRPPSPRTGYRERHRRERFHARQHLHIIVAYFPVTVQSRGVSLNGQV